MKKSLALFLTVAIMAILMGCNFSFSAGSKGESNPEAEKAAEAAARAWLELVDNGQYAESWEEAATLFRKVITKEDWVQLLESRRKPFGEMISRELDSAKFLTEVPAAPDGQYVMIQFRASFKNKRSLVETITPMLDEDGTWRVSGYYMK